MPDERASAPESSVDPSDLPFVQLYTDGACRGNPGPGEGKSRKPVKNEDLWREMDVLLAKHSVGFQIVKGHAGHPENERCDELAVEAAEQYR